MLRKFLAVAALVIVLASSWVNVSLAGQRDRLRQKVHALAERIAILEYRMEDAAYVMADEVVGLPGCAGTTAVWEPADVFPTDSRLSC